jgi:hypothetical protein
MRIAPERAGPESICPVDLWLLLKGVTHIRAIGSETVELAMSSVYGAGPPGPADGASRL